ncbi:MAG: tyrosine-type recombinase/integrase [Tenericutes bacterium]|nr:tyrosine-type recombinase/integrase [Mycoplasmatota bacterium]
MRDSKLRQSISEFIEYSDVKPITKESYKRILMEYIKYVEPLSKPPIREDVKQYRNILMDKHAARTVQKYIVVIRNFYEWLYAEGKGDNIAIGIKGVKIENDFKREPLSTDEAHKLLEYAAERAEEGILKLRNFAIISLMITTGLRTIEVERADVNDIHFIEDAYALFVMGKGRDDKDAYVKLSPQVYEIITEYLFARSDQYIPLFINHGRRQKRMRISTRTLSKTVKEYLQDIGIDSSKYTAHSLRHTAATMAMLEGAGLHSTQHMLRHKSPNTTQIYLHKITRRKEFYEKKISERLFGEILTRREDKK